MLLPRRAAAFWEGPEGIKGRNRESRSREAAGRRNYPEAVLYKGMSRETSSPRLGAETVFYRHSAQLIGRAPTVCEWSSSGVLFVSSREAARHFFPSVVPFHGCDSAIRFLKRTSLTVFHLRSGNAWSYLRLVVYGFLGLSEGA